MKDPKGTFAKTVKKGTLEDGVIHTVLSSGFSAVVVGVLLALTFFSSPQLSSGFTSAMGFPSMSGIMGAAMFLMVLMYVGYALFYLIVWDSVSLLVSSGVVYLLAKGMGGTGTYGKQTFLLALVQAPLRIGLYLFTLPLLLGSFLIKTVPALGWALFGTGLIGAAALSIVSIVYQVWAMKIVHKVRTSTAALALLLPMVAMLIVVVIIAGMMTAIFSAAGGAGVSPQSLLI